MQTEEKNIEIKRRWSKRRNSLQKCFHPFKYIKDHIRKSKNEET